MGGSTLRVTKMHGLGNNYIYVNEFEQSLAESTLPGLARKLSDVHTGIGSDGLILIGPSMRADFRMRIFNADGSEGRNCGNGLRCVAKYAFERRLTDKRSFTIETLGGLMKVYVHTEADAQVEGCEPALSTRRVHSVTVNMGAPQFARKAIPMLGDPDGMAIDEEIVVDGVIWRITAVSVGNPHAVLFVPDVRSIPLADIGPRIECAPMFPDKANVEFISIRNRREIDFRVWERGSGITQACGTGACAAVAAGVLNGLLEMNAPVSVHLPGGDLEIVWSAADSHLYMKGPAAFVLDGEFILNDQ